MSHGSLRVFAPCARARACKRRRAPHPRLLIERCKGSHRWTVERGPIDREMRAVAGAVPAALERIPVDVTAEMGTHGRAAVQPALLVAIGGHFAQALPHDGAGSRLP